MSLATLSLSHPLPRAQQGKFAPGATKNPRQVCETAEFDEGGSIGKRYRRQDEIGTPWGITVDHQTMEDDTVTLRDRDSLEQSRVPIDGLADDLAKRLAQPWRSPKLD